MRVCRFPAATTNKDEALVLTLESRQSFVPAWMSSGNGLGEVDGGLKARPDPLVANLDNPLLPQVPGSMKPGIPGQMPGQVPGQMQGQVPGQMQGQVPGQMQGQVQAQMQGQVPSPQIPGQIPAQIPGQVPSPQIPGQISAQAVPVQVPAPYISNKPMDKPGGTKRAASEEAGGSPASKKQVGDADLGDWGLNGGIKGVGDPGVDGGNKQVRRNRKMMPAAYGLDHPLKDGKTREDAWMAESAEEQRRIFEEKATAEEREIFRLHGAAGGKGDEIMMSDAAKADASSKEKKPRGGQPGNKRFPERDAESIHTVPAKFQASCQVLLRMAISADYCSNLEMPESEQSFTSGIFVAAMAHGHPQVTGGRAAHKSAAAALKNVPRAVVIQSPYGKKAHVQDAILVLQQMLACDSAVTEQERKEITDKKESFVITEMSTSSSVDQAFGEQASAAPTHLRGGGKDPYKMVHASGVRGASAAFPYKCRPLFKQSSSVFACCNLSKDQAANHPGFRTNVISIAVERGHPPLVRGKPSEDALAEASSRRPKAHVLMGLVGARKDGLEEALGVFQQALVAEPNSYPNRKYDVEVVSTQEAAKVALISPEDRAKKIEKERQQQQQHQHHQHVGVGQPVNMGLNVNLNPGMVGSVGVAQAHVVGLSDSVSVAPLEGGVKPGTLPMAVATVVPIPGGGGIPGGMKPAAPPPPGK